MQLKTEYQSLFNNNFSKPAKIYRKFHFTFELTEPELALKGCPLYSLDSRKSKTLENYILEKLALGHIALSKSPVVSPVILLPKGASELRVCIDYWKLNLITKSDHYPLPLLQDIVSMIS